MCPESRDEEGSVTTLFAIISRVNSIVAAAKRSVGTARLPLSVRRPRRALVLVVGAAAVAIAIGLSVAWLDSAPAASQSPGAVAKATRGNVVDTVGGVGRIVESGVSTDIAVPAAAGTGGSSGATASGSTAAPTTSATAVFPQTSGRLARFLVSPGQVVAAGQPLAVLDDRGVAGAAIAQAQNDVATALAELRQKRTSDPLKGLPPTRAELAAARGAVRSARMRLARLLRGPLPADVSAARLDVRRAEADLETLVGGTPEQHAEAVLLAQHNVELAQERLDKLFAPPSAADVATAQAEVKKAEADLALLLQPYSGALPSAIAAARAALNAAQRRLEQLLAPPLASDVAAARLDVLKAEADLVVLRARGGPASPVDIALARLKVVGAQLRLANARVAKPLLVVRAPSRGTVTALLTVAGAPVDPFVPVATVADLDRLAVNVDLSEFDVARVRPGLRAVVSVDALGGKSFPGRVAFAGLTGTNASGVVLFPVSVDIAYARGLRPGMNVSVRIVVARRLHVVQVPLEAVSRDEEDRPFVNVVGTTGETSLRKVTLGLASNKNVEIVKGLRAGERVALPQSQGGAEGD